MHKAFCHLKGWYWAATETQARPCFQTMEKQTVEHVDLHQRRDSPGLPVAVNIAPVDVQDDAPTDEEIMAAVNELTNRRSAGASCMRAEHLKEWLQGMKSEEDPEMGPNNVGAGDRWRALAWLVQAIWDKGRIPLQHRLVVTVLIPKGGGDYRGIGLLKPIWKVIERVMDHRLEVIALHDSLHGCRNGRGTGTAVIKAKLTQQLAHIEQAPFYGVFINLRKAFHAMDWEWCLFMLEGHGIGPSMRCLIRHFWDEATNVCRASGNYGTPFKTGRGVTQSGPLSAKLFNVMVDAVVREWLQILQDKSGLEGEELDKMMDTLFAIFYAHNAYIAARDPVFLQRAIDGLVSTFECVGHETNISKTKAMICTPGKIQLQLPADSYWRMGTGRTSAAKWDTYIITCRECGKDMRAGSLSRYLADLHKIYQGQVVAEELLNRHEGVCTQQTRGMASSNAHSPSARGSWQAGG